MYNIYFRVNHLLNNRHMNHQQILPRQKTIVLFSNKSKSFTLVKLFLLLSSTGFQIDLLLIDPVEGPYLNVK